MPDYDRRVTSREDTVVSAARPRATTKATRTRARILDAAANLLGGENDGFAIARVLSL